MYLLVTAVWKKPVTWRGQQFNLPPPGLSSFMVGTAMLDIAVASSVLYVLLPPEMGITLPMAMSVYLMAIVVVITLHIPGGLGAFEAVVIGIIAPGKSPHLEDLAGSLIVFRAIYCLLPLVTASLAFVGHEIWHLRPVNKPNPEGEK